MGNAHNTAFLRDIPGGRAPRISLSFRPWFMAVVVTWVLAAVPCLRAQSSKPSDYDAKPAFLFNFVRFVDLQANLAFSQNNPFTACVIRHTPFGPPILFTLYF